ncbi:MAG: PepSY domain-containing protein [Clostridiales bacterium]|nr:PepSY domain-containing protein [Clostridiales bacterium]
MDEKRLQGHIIQAVKWQCAHLHPDPCLVQKVLREAERKESTPVRRKMSLGFALVLVLLLLTTTAVAAVLLSGMELVEREAVPMAVGNDGEVRPEEKYTYEELKAIIMTAEENGIFLDDDSSVMRALRMGEGYWEEETIMELCRTSFGGLIYEWTVEEQHFFEDMMVEIGWSQSNGYPLPGENDMPSETARALARRILREAYGADLPLDDPALYRSVEEFFAQGDDQLYDEINWQFTFYPRTLDGATYTVRFDSQGGHVSHDRFVPDMQVYGYDEQSLVGWVDSVYNYRKAGTGMRNWKAEAWYAFGQKLPKATHSEAWDEAFDGYAASVYLLPGEGDLTRKQARNIAFADAGVKDYTNVSELLLGQGDQRIWKISFSTAEVNGTRQLLSYEIDSQTHEILRKLDLTNEAAWACYMLDETYLAHAPELALTQDKAIELAVAALHAKLGDDTIPYTDKESYTIDVNAFNGNYHFMFRTRLMEYGNASVRVYAGGKVDIWFANPPGLDGDKLFKRYEDIYGPNIDWMQDTWYRFGQDMAKYEPTTFEGKLFKQTAYPEESTVAISRDKAMDIAYLDSGKSEINRIVLIGAEPNPIWKLRVSTEPVTTLYEIDAMTGEILDKEYYFIQLPDFDHTMKMYTLRRTYMPAALQEFGVERIAAELLAKAQVSVFGTTDSPDSVLYGNYRVGSDGMTVTFESLSGDIPSYVVTVAEDAMSAQVEVGAISQEARQTTNLDIAAIQEAYGSDERFWPLEVRYEYYGRQPMTAAHPAHSPITQEEAQAYAMQHLVAQMGQEAVDALGDVRVGCILEFIELDGSRVRWTFYFANPENVHDGWRVVFAVTDGLPSEHPDIKQIDDMGNG